MCTGGGSNRHAGADMPSDGGCTANTTTKQHRSGRRKQICSDGHKYGRRTGGRTRLDDVQTAPEPNGWMNGLDLISDGGADRQVPGGQAARHGRHENAHARDTGNSTRQITRANADVARKNTSADGQTTINVVVIRVVTTSKIRVEKEK